MAKKRQKEVTIRSSAAEYLTFVAATGDSKESVEVRYKDENIWITQKMLAVLYEVEPNTINYHIKKIFEDSELEEDSVIRNFRSSEKVLWRKVLDIYATSIDYNQSAESKLKRLMLRLQKTIFQKKNLTL